MDITTQIRKARESKGLTKTEMAKMLGISSQLLGQYEQGRQSPKVGFYIKWKQVFGEDLVETNVSRETGDDKYVRLLQDNDQYFKGLIKSNLETATFVQATILAHLKAMVQFDADAKSAGDKRKRERVLSAWNRRIAEGLGLTAQRDNVEAEDKTGRA